MWYQADTRWQQPFREKEPRLRRRSTPKECAIGEPAGRNSSPNLHTLLHRAHDVHTQQQQFVEVVGRSRLVSLDIFFGQGRAAAAAAFRYSYTTTRTRAFYELRELTQLYDRI
uniref:(northern house mosquito) hypothetical protein n=1 Tax=Culex pipiens TaxID=7175 RepID=A0A8D8KHU6_CULPI